MFRREIVRVREATGERKSDSRRRVSQNWRLGASNDDIHHVIASFIGIVFKKEVIWKLIGACGSVRSIRVESFIGSFLSVFVNG